MGKEVERGRAIGGVKKIFDMSSDYSWPDEHSNHFHYRLTKKERVHVVELSSAALRPERRLSQAMASVGLVLDWTKQ